MKASVYKREDTYIVTIDHKHQHFTLNYESANKRECQFMADMFNIALENHDQDNLEELFQQARTSKDATRRVRENVGLHRTFADRGK